MIKRFLTKPLKGAIKHFPIVGIVGPRQSGKTTLAKIVFPEFTYVNLEQLDNRRFAKEDPRGFLNQYNHKVIIDEVQRVPELFSYLQVAVDEKRINGQYVLTGSQHFLMMESISQTLAGRIALFNLYPLSLDELTSAKINIDDTGNQIIKGGYPRLYDEKVEPNIWLQNYIQTYLDRDVSLLSQIDNLTAFEKFIHLLAGRTGQLLNLSSLGGDVGVSHNTIKSWLSLLETSGIIFLLRPYFTNISKRLNKSPKLYFIDTGLVCSLLSIHNKQQLINHPLYGSIFETLIVSEALKHYTNLGIKKDIYFWRDQQGLEADLIIEKEAIIELVEIKSSQTIPENIFGRLSEIASVLNTKTNQNLIYGGKTSSKRSSGSVWSWKDLNKLL